MTNEIRGELGGTGVLVVGVHCGYIDTDMAAHVAGPKNTPESIAAQAFDAVEAGRTEVLADERTRRAKADLSRPGPGTDPAQTTSRPRCRPFLASGHD
ncbi:Rossmann-fold NAD(P)-binding domain-containing protein [Streptomyces sp. NPDC002589]|uniref:hypothetical protein n=1 Tax=Streptomyces sp. NPDC002589 TaxID=3154420 RepID=UPI0033280885